MCTTDRQEGGKDVIDTGIWFRKYRIIKKLGEGGSGNVYLAEHIRLGYLRAIKQIYKHQTAYSQLMKEADILKDLTHPGIPVIYDVEEDEQYSYIIMEYVEGLSLSTLCKQQGCIKEKEIICICSQICEILQFLHSAEQPILYLDLKPANIILRETKVKIIDFGAALPEQQTEKGILMGTRGFAAPEQFFSEGVSKESDIYGLGSLMLYMATGLQSKIGMERLETDRNYSTGLKAVIYQCLKYNKSERFETIDMVQESLHRVGEKTEEKTLPLSSTSIVLAFAGVQPRCGVTHICLMLTEYLKLHGENAVYVEAGEKRDIYRLYEERKEPKVPVLCGRPERLQEKYQQYSVFICDYGVYQTASEKFWQADAVCLITGAKPWELSFFQKAQSFAAQKKNIWFLINFVGAKEFFELAKGKKEQCLRMPYRDVLLEEDRELSELLEKLLKRSIRKRDVGYKKFITKNSLFGWRRTWCRSYPYRHITGRVSGGKKRGADAVFRNESS